MPRHTDPPALAFPLVVRSTGPALASRSQRVRGQIEQVVFTDPGERVYRPEFGAGARSMVFEPLGEPLRVLAQKRLTASLAEALRGEVDPSTIDVRAEIDDARLTLTIAYTLAALGVREVQVVTGSGAT